MYSRSRPTAVFLRTWEWAGVKPYLYRLIVYLLLYLDLPARAFTYCFPSCFASAPLVTMDCKLVCLPLLWQLWTDPSTVKTRNLHRAAFLSPHLLDHRSLSLMDSRVRIRSSLTPRGYARWSDPSKPRDQIRCKTSSLLDYPDAKPTTAIVLSLILDIRFLKYEQHPATPELATLYDR